jgi:RHS repeat-associated protein
VSHTYAYDGEGRRVRRYNANNGVVTWFVYDAFGNVAAEYTNTTPTGTTTEYLTTDHLGSTRLVTGQSGAELRCLDYLPFGQELAASTSGRGSCFPTGTQVTYPTTSADVLTQKFTGKERDTESGLDYFVARYFSSPQGRFTGPDPFNILMEVDDRDEFTAHISNPQNWNKYAYVWNNPFKYVDPTGEAVYLVTYTTGNSQGDEELRRAAQTRAQELRRQKGFDPRRDTVVLAGVKTKQDFANAINQANSLAQTYGGVGEISLYSHSGPADGPIFHDLEGRATQFSQGELSQLSVNWQGAACARFFGCNTAVAFAQRFADAQQVPADGYRGYAYFSSDARRRADPSQPGSLYLIDAPGYHNGGLWGALKDRLGKATARPMTRKYPRRQ